MINDRFHLFHRLFGLIPKNSLLIAVALEPALAASPVPDPGPSPRASALVWPKADHEVRGSLEVDPDSGIVSVCFPLGPGIGRPGLHFSPTLVGRFAPQVGPNSRPPSMGRPGLDGFELSPGTLTFPLIPLRPDGAPPGVRWTFPDGTGGCADGPGDGNPEEILAQFGYGPPSRPDHLPHPGSASSAPLALAGAGGERLIALASEAEAPGTTSANLERGPQGDDPWSLPGILLVARGNLAYEYQYTATLRPGPTSGVAHYRLTAVRAPSGESVTFTYGPNGVDFIAAWADAKVQVVLEAAESVPPVPALNAGLFSAQLEDPSAAFRDAEACLRITYKGPIPGYTVSFLLRGEDLAPVKHPVYNPQSTAARPEALPSAFHSPLQVVRVKAEGSEDRIEFTYGKAPARSLASPHGTWHWTPTVLKAITLPQRRIQLDWESQAGPEGSERTSGYPGTEGSLCFGVKAIRELGAPTYGRTAPGSASCAWVRQSRHFAFAPDARASGSCKTYVRDRWILQGDGREAQFQLPGGRQVSCFDGIDIPTFAWDSGDRLLVPVPGKMTRRPDWDLGSTRAPDLHRAGYNGTATGGLMGGNPIPGGTMAPLVQQWQEENAWQAAEFQRRQVQLAAQIREITSKSAADLALRSRAATELAEQLRQSMRHAQAHASAQAATARAEHERIEIEQQIKQQQDEINQREARLKNQEEEINRQIEELKRQSQELEKQAKELAKQAKELAQQTPA